jgi:uncharacterized protein YbaR (Trm112 family)
MSADLSWLEKFIPLLRCPATKQSLRWASNEEKTHASIPVSEKALATADGKHLYPISDGIPILLPPQP